MEEQSYLLILAYFEKTISDDGLTRLQEWIEESAEHLEEFSETIQILEASGAYFNQPIRQKESWERIQKHIAPPSNPVEESGFSKSYWMAYAAISILICSLSLFIYSQQREKKQKEIIYATVSNPEGRQSKVLLPDSSIIYLGGGSSLRYQKQFSGAKRTVYLDGEAFFEVIHDAKRPFIVKSGTIETVVLGTSFNVKAFAANHKVEVTVKTGKVGVMTSANGKKGLVKYLLPDDRLAINSETGLYTLDHVNATEVSAWINYHFIFYNTTLSDIASALEHRYGVQIAFTDPDLGRIMLTAKFNNISLEQVMKNLSMLTGLTYTQKENQVFISDKQQKGGRL